MDEGYSPAPIVTDVTQSAPGMLTVNGKALPEGRVRFILGPQRAIGVTADSKGRFSADLPANPRGSVFDLLMEDRGRLMHAEGRLFVPPGQPGKSVIMRPGAPSLSIAAQALGISMIDYDAAGALAITGRVAPKAKFKIVVGGEEWPQPAADDKGMFTALIQIPPPGKEPESLDVSVVTTSASWHRDLTVTLPSSATDQTTPIPEGWRVDWQVPGGGMQTTLVF